MFTEEHYSQHDRSTQTCPIYRQSSVKCFASEQRVYTIPGQHDWSTQIIDKVLLNVLQVNRESIQISLVFPVVCVPRGIPWRVYYSANP